MANVTSPFGLGAKQINALYEPLVSTNNLINPYIQYSDMAGNKASVHQMLGKCRHYLPILDISLQVAV